MIKNDNINYRFDNDTISQESASFIGTIAFPEFPPKKNVLNQKTSIIDVLPEVLVITSYPPRECGIATYSLDLIMALKNKFSTSFSLKVCALESGTTEFKYPDEVECKLDTDDLLEYAKLAKYINTKNTLKIVLIQHEFGLFQTQKDAFIQLLHEISKPIVIVFHSVLPLPNEVLKNEVKSMAASGCSFIVMTNYSAKILIDDYDIPSDKISVIAHGTHLVPHLSKEVLKEKYELIGKNVLSTFGLLNSGKSIETTLDALPSILKINPEVVFLVLGKTHPMVVKSEGEKYRSRLEAKVSELNIQNNVRFINSYLALPELLEYLQLTDIYLFTSNDPNQAVSGTFSYAMSCACPIISTPIPHALEVLSDDTGIIIDFQNSQQLADSVIRLLNDTQLRKNISSNTLQKIVSSAWENSAVDHAMLLEKISDRKILLKYKWPNINLNHIKNLTTDIGIIQFSKINQPDIASGYTLDDNARALIATCMHYELTRDYNDLVYLHRYLDFISFCLQPSGAFLNYVDEDKKFTDQNNTNLDDANGRAIWALGYIISKKSLLPENLIVKADNIFQKAILTIDIIHSTRAMAFVIKGIYYYHSVIKTEDNVVLITTFANRLLEMYKHESTKDWEWFESYLTYANSVLSEAMLYAWLVTDNPQYRFAALESFNFLLSSIFNEKGIEVISNKSWLNKGQQAGRFGEQPIDVAYTIMTLSKFYDELNDEKYYTKLVIAFNWFLGNNRLHQIIYNTCTGGCYDGLEENHVNLNQGAESTVSYLMARLTIEKYSYKNKTPDIKIRNHFKIKTKLDKLVYSTEYKNF